MWNFWSPVEDVWISRFYNLSLEIPGRSCYLLFLIGNSKRLHKTITFSLMMQTYVFFGGMSLQSSPSFLERVSVNFPGIKLVWTVFGGENEKLNICRQVLTSSTQLKTGHFTSLIGRERLRNIRSSKKWRRQRRPQHHKSMIWLVERGKIIMLHVEHAFWHIFFEVVCQTTTWDFHIWDSDDDTQQQLICR